MYAPAYMDKILNFNFRERSLKEILVYNSTTGVWVPIRMENLKKGDLFKIVYKNKEKVYYANNNPEYDSEVDSMKINCLEFRGGGI